MECAFGTVVRVEEAEKAVKKGKIHASVRNVDLALLSGERLFVAADLARCLYCVLPVSLCTYANVYGKRRALPGHSPSGAVRLAPASNLYSRT